MAGRDWEGKKKAEPSEQAAEIVHLSIQLHLKKSLKNIYIHDNLSSISYLKCVTDQ